MSRRNNLIVACAALLAAAAAGVCADRPSVNLEASTLGQYVWRGLVLTNGPVLQTSSTVGYRGLHLNVFTNQDLNNVNGRSKKVNELDFDFGYDHSREKVTLSAGLIRYTFPNTSSAATTELYTGATLAVPLRPSVKGYFDVDAIKGAYVTFDISHGFALPKLHPGVSWAAEFAAGVGAGSSGHNAGYYGVKQLALADFHPSLALPISYKRLRVTPRLSYSSLLDEHLCRGPAAKAHNFFGGISLALTL